MYVHIYNNILSRNIITRNKMKDVTVKQLDTGLYIEHPNSFIFDTYIYSI